MCTYPGTYQASYTVCNLPPEIHLLLEEDGESDPVQVEDTAVNEDQKEPSSLLEGLKDICKELPLPV